jgi:hypothetical protein
MERANNKEAWEFNKQCLRQWLRQFREAKYFVTVTLNRSPDSTRGEEWLKKVHVAIDKRLFGKHFSKSTDRTRFIAVPETTKGKNLIHYHLLLIPPATSRPGTNIDDVLHQVSNWFADEQRRINMDIKPIYTSADWDRFADYMTKDAWSGATFDGVVASDSFLPKDDTSNKDQRTEWQRL